MPLRVYGQPQNPRVRKVLVAATLAGLSPEVVDLKKEDFTKPEHTKRFRSYLMQTSTWKNSSPRDRSRNYSPKQCHS